MVCKSFEEIGLKTTKKQKNDYDGLDNKLDMNIIMVAFL